MKAQWITCGKDIVTPLFRKYVTLSSFEKAVIDISGLGYFTLLVNGRRVTDELFTPAFTNYGPRDLSTFAYPLFDTLSERVLYMSYDITAYLHEGENVIDVIVGNGWFRQHERICECREVYGESLVAAFDLTLTDKNGQETVISTDGSEQGFVYPILESELFFGETIDTRLFDAPLTEIPVFVSDFTPKALYRQTCPSDRIIRTLQPKYIGCVAGKRIYDAGENISGTVSLTVKGEAGSRVIVRYAELVNDDGLDFHTTGSDYTCGSGRLQIQTDTFILNGREQTLDVMFVYHGFRYFDIEGDAELKNVAVNVIHTDLAVTSTFSCDNAILNWLYDAYLRTQLDNIHGCIPSDCPHRERLGYTGDGQICAPTAMLMLDSLGMYKKWIEDILDCQDIESGHVQHTAPLMGGGGGPGGWGCAMVTVPWAYYLRSGDEAMLAHTFPAMKRWLGYMTAHCEDYLLTHEEEKGWCLGDWAAPAKMVIPQAYVNTCYLVKSLEIMSAIARILKNGEADALAEAALPYKKALFDRYFDGTSYCGGVQGADAFAIWAGLEKSETLLDGLCARYEALGVFDTGFLCTDILCEVLFENGRGDLALRLMASESTDVGFNYMISRGATTIYEYLSSDANSLNHPMFGACARQLLTGLLGIRRKKGTAGYTDLVIEPCLSGLVRKAEGSIMTPFGTVGVCFSLDDKCLKIAVPEGIGAECRMGDKTVALSAGENVFSL